MDNRRPGVQRPQPPQRAVSGSGAHQPGLKRPALLSRLSNVRSISQPAHLIDVRVDDAHGTNADGFLDKPEQMTTSPGAFDGDADDHNERPAKRAKLSGDALPLESGLGPQSEEEQETANRVTPGSPLPPPPKQRSLAAKGTTLRCDGTVKNGPARRAHGLDPPLMATRLPAPRKAADFFPWNGQHPEDVLSENVVKSGYTDRASVPSAAEFNSAKATIWPNLSQKNNMGLQTLSYLFTSVMEKRQAIGKCSATSTFKPPPRVTVTDTKREAWLRDLANTNIPLRKQSRTIPHGIRGKLLLEQCLGKKIPMNRAVWLAKCVGANELRAFRRKGIGGAAAASGESKYIREWTVSVEQFLEEAIANCGQPDWRTKMDYAAKLVATFFSEQLLERDHYLDWTVKSFEQASPERLAIWIILTQLYWKDILKYGRRGRRLAEAILAKLHSIHQGDVSVHPALRTRLQKLIIVMAATGRGCLILPRVWKKYGYLLTADMLSTDQSLPTAPIENISKRNNRLIEPLLNTAVSTRCPLLEVYLVLDNVGLNYDIEAVSNRCLRILTNPRDLVHAYIEWSASVYRVGLSRVYLAAALIARLHANGHDIDGAIMEFLQQPKNDSLSFDNVILVICELVRLRSFSVARYLQWVMTTGMLSSGESGASSAALLSALPRHSLPQHLASTRQMLAKRADLDLDDASTVARLEADVDHILATEHPTEPDLLDRIEQLNTGAKFDLIRQISAKARMSTKSQSITLRSFCIIRQLCEHSKDLVALADMVDCALDSSDPILLATVSDTLSMHPNVFAAVGKLRPSVDRLLEKYRSMRAQQALDRTLILSVKTLIQLFAPKAPMTGLLDNDLAICEQQSSMMVCSPASDNLVSMQSSTLDSDDDIDAVFASGNTMDEALMQRVFSRILQRASKLSAESLYAPSKISGWFNQLRSVDALGFDQLMKQHLLSCLHGVVDSSTASVVSSFVASGCAGFDDILESAKEARTPSAPSFLLHLLTTDVAVNDSLHATEKYRYRLQQELYLRGAADKVLSIIRCGLDDMKDPTSLEPIIQLMLRYAVSNPTSLRKVLGDIPQPSTSFSTYRRLILGSLMPQNSQGRAEMQLDAKSIIGLANPLSIFHSAQALDLVSKALPEYSSASSNELQDAILEAVTNGSAVWPQLFETAGRDTICGVYEWAKERVMTFVTYEGDHENFPDQADIQRNLDILDVAHHAVDLEDSSPDILAIAERIKALDDTLHTVDTAKGSQRRQHAICSLGVLLHLSTLHFTAISGDSDAVRQSRCELLGALCSLLANPELQPYQPELEYVYDIASAISDDLPESILLTLPKHVIALAARDARVASIIGCAPSPDAWLALVSQPPLQGTQQQRALMKQQQQLAARQGQKASPGGKTADVKETKTVPFALRRWEIIPDAAPTVGENDTSLSLGLFAARRV